MSAYQRVMDEVRWEALYHRDHFGTIDKVLRDLRGKWHGHYGSAKRAFVGPDEDGVMCLHLPGEDGNYASVPDSPELSITGDIDLQVLAALDDYTNGLQYLIGKYGGAGARSYGHAIAEAGTSRLRVLWTEDGTTAKNLSSSNNGLVDGEMAWTRSAFDVNDGAGDAEVSFQKGGASPTPVWSEFDSALVGAPTSIFDGASVVGIGGTATGTSTAKGRIYHVIIKDGIDGTTVLEIDFTKWTAGATSGTAETGQTVTINATGATAADPSDRLMVGRGWYFSGVADNIWTVAGLSNSTAYDYTVTYTDGSTATGEETTDGSGNLVLGGTQSNFDDKHVRSINVYPDGGTGVGDTVAFAPFNDSSVVTEGDSTFTDAYSLTWTPGFSATGYTGGLIDGNLIQGATDDYITIPVPAGSALDVTNADLFVLALYRSYVTGAYQGIIAKRAGIDTADAGWILWHHNSTKARFEVCDGTTEMNDLFDSTYTAGMLHAFSGEWDESAGEAEVSMDNVGTGTPASSPLGSFSNSEDMLVFRISGIYGNGFLAGLAIGLPDGTNFTTAEINDAIEALTEPIPSGVLRHPVKVLMHNGH